MGKVLAMTVPTQRQGNCAQDKHESTENFTCVRTNEVPTVEGKALNTKWNLFLKNKGKVLCLFPTITVIWFQPKQTPQANTLGVAIPVRFHWLPSSGLADSSIEKQNKSLGLLHPQAFKWCFGLRGYL